MIEKRHDSPDGITLRCYSCRTHLSPRHGSIYFRSSQSLYTLTQILVCFAYQVPVTTTAHLLGVRRMTVSHHYSLFRQDIGTFLCHHIVTFPTDDIVEIDEIQLRPLNERALAGNIVMGWALGMVSRKTGKRVMEVMCEHSQVNMMLLVQKHVNAGAVIITNGWNAYKILNYRYVHFVAHKRHIGSGLFVDTYYVCKPDGYCIAVHSNTIEGMFSHFRSQWHISKGWPKEYVQFICDEFTFRSLEVSLLVPLKAV